MKLTIKKQLNKYVIYKEDKAVLAKVGSPFLQGGKMQVYDSGGGLLYTVTKERGIIKIKGTHTENMGGQLLYKRREEGTLTGNCLSRPPLAEKFILRTLWGEIRIEQSLQRRFTIYRENRQIGEMTHMLSFVKRMEMTQDTVPEEFCGVLFGLGLYMLREDDVDIV